MENKARFVALIDENRCIGCTLCIQACPVDAILGAAKQMHTVISLECIGCKLCIAPCPVDCIAMIADPAKLKNKQTAELAKARHQFRQFRLARDKQERTAKLAQHRETVGQQVNLTPMDAKQTLIEQVLAKAKAKYQQKE